MLIHHILMSFEHVFSTFYSECPVWKAAFRKTLPVKLLANEVLFTIFELASLSSFECSLRYFLLIPSFIV